MPALNAFESEISPTLAQVDPEIRFFSADLRPVKAPGGGIRAAIELQLWPTDLITVSAASITFVSSATQVTVNLAARCSGDVQYFPELRVADYRRTHSRFARWLTETVQRVLKKKRCLCGHALRGAAAHDVRRCVRNYGLSGSRYNNLIHTLLPTGTDPRGSLVRAEVHVVGRRGDEEVSIRATWRWSDGAWVRDREEPLSRYGPRRSP